MAKGLKAREKKKKKKKTSKINGVDVVTQNNKKMGQRMIAW